VVLQDGTNTYVYGMDLISATDGSGNQTYFTYDGLGSTTDLTDGAANSVATYSYDVFGAIRSQIGSSGNYWQFTGEQRDPSEGLYFLRARYYDLATGRFLTQDPLPGSAFLPETHAPYSYVGANPVNRLDPSGRTWVPEHRRETGSDKEGGMGPAEGGPNESPCYYPTPDCKFDIHVDLGKISEYWECVNLGIGLAAAIATIVAANPWIAGVALAISVTGEIVIEGDEGGAAKGLGGAVGVEAAQWEINAQFKLHGLKYIPWMELGAKGFGEWSLSGILLLFDAWNCGKSVGFVS
jgi:RHS repeat-associated protein